MRVPSGVLDGGSSIAGAPTVTRDEPAEFSRPGLFPTPEQYLVLRAALSDGAVAIDAYRQWRRTLDIDAPFNRDVFRLLPLMYDNLRRLGVEDDLSARLKGVYRMSWVKTQRLIERTRPIIAGFVDAGLPVLAVKGAPLAMLYYDNPVLRPMADFDLVIPPDAVPLATEVLGRCGYRSRWSFEPDSVRFRHALLFRDADRNEFDLHWHVATEFCDEGADRWFWRDSQPFEVCGRVIRAPDATRMMFHTLLHGVRWNEEPPIRWIADAMFVLRRQGANIDWRALAGFAEQRAVCRRIWLALSWLRDKLGADVPLEIVERLGGQPLTWVERIENGIILRSTEEVCSGPLGWLPVEVAPFLRHAQGAGPLRFGGDLLRYLRFTWKLERRRDIPGYLARRFLQRAHQPAHAT